jgi:2'-5' RNA ligase
MLIWVPPKIARTGRRTPNEHEQGRLFGEATRSRDKVYFALKPDAESVPQFIALAEQLSLAFPLTGRPTIGTLHVSVLGLGHAADLRPDQYAIAAEVGRMVRFPPFQVVFTRLMTFGTGRHQVPLVLIADDDSANDVNDLALMLKGELLSRGFPPGGRVGGQAHLTLLYDRFRVPELPLEVPIVLRAEGVALVRNHHGRGRHDRQFFPFGRRGADRSIG